MSADQPAQKRGELGQDIGQENDSRLQGLPARIGEELAHQICGPLGVLADLHDVGKGRVARRVAQ